MQDKNFHCLSNAMHGQNIKLPVCVCVCVCVCVFYSPMVYELGRLANDSRYGLNTRYMDSFSRVHKPK